MRASVQCFGNEASTEVVLNTSFSAFNQSSRACPSRNPRCSKISYARLRIRCSSIASGSPLLVFWLTPGRAVRFSSADSSILCCDCITLRVTLKFVPTFFGTEIIFLVAILGGVLSLLLTHFHVADRIFRHGNLSS